MAATSQRLARQGIQIEEFPQSTPNLTAASQNLYELINGHNLIAYHDAAMRLSVSRAVAIESPADGGSRKKSSRTRSTWWWRWQWPAMPLSQWARTSAAVPLPLASRHSAAGCFRHTE
jgi:hypothetical protein